MLHNNNHYANSAGDVGKRTVDVHLYNILINIGKKFSLGSEMIKVIKPSKNIITRNYKLCNCKMYVIHNKEFYKIK